MGVLDGLKMMKTLLYLGSIDCLLFLWGSGKAVGHSESTLDSAGLSCFARGYGSGGKLGSSRI